MYLSKSNLTSWCLPVVVTVYLRYFFPLMVLLHVLSPSLYLLHCDIHGKAGSHWEAHKRRLQRRKCPPRTKTNAMCLDDMLLTGFNIEAGRLYLLHCAYLWLDKTVTVVVIFLASLVLLPKNCLSIGVNYWNQTEAAKMGKMLYGNTQRPLAYWVNN